ncbi:MAG: hypothetical protein DRP24_06545 [Thermotoga sp.]|nr:MAG: hypothetical protein DRP24_06545 [Thermotoga sp.]
MEEIKEKVDRLEYALMRLAYTQQKTEMELQEFKREMQEFKNEMQEFKGEMQEFKNEMLEFKNEMREFKDWSKKNIENLNRQWGNLANKLGTLVEDIFAPSIDIVIKRHFKIAPDRIYTNLLVRKNGDELELDIVASSVKEKKLFVVEVKANPDREEYVERFQRKLSMVFEYLPEYAGFELLPIYAGFSMKENTVKKLSQLGIYAMVVRGDILEIVNFDDIRKS